MQEINDLRELLAPIDLKGALLTADALHTNTVTCELLHAKKADYVLPLKENCPARLAEVVAEFDYRFKDEPKSLSVCSGTEKGHGRVEERRAWALNVDSSWFDNLKDWKGLRSVIRLERTRYIQAKDKEEREVRYFLSSLAAEQIEQSVRAIRAHWSVENQGHWCLDMVLDDDRNRSRRGHSGKNLAILKRIALNMLRKTPSGPNSLRRKQLAAAITDRYLRTVLDSL